MKKNVLNLVLLCFVALFASCVEKDYEETFKSAPGWSDHASKIRTWKAE